MSQWSTTASLVVLCCLAISSDVNVSMVNNSITCCVVLFSNLFWCKCLNGQQQRHLLCCLAITSVSKQIEARVFVMSVDFCVCTLGLPFLPLFLFLSPHLPLFPPPSFPPSLPPSCTHHSHTQTLSLASALLPTLFIPRAKETTRLREG